MARALPGSTWVWALLALAVAGGLLLRVHGLDYAATYGPDQEPSVARALRHLSTGDLNPHFFDYPSLFSYLLAVAFAAMRLFLGMPLPPDVEPMGFTLSFNPDLVPMLQPYHLIARRVTAFMGVASIVLVFGAARRLYGPWTGALAALFLALAPLHIWDSHFAAVDVPTTFWVTAALYATSRALGSARLRWFVLAGSAVGLAAATKYPAGVMLLGPLAASLALRHRSYGVRGAPILASMVLRLIVTTGTAAIVIAAVAWTQRPWINELIAQTSQVPGLDALAARLIALLAVAGVLALAWAWAIRRGIVPAVMLADAALHPTTLIAVAAAGGAFVIGVPVMLIEPRTVLAAVYGLSLFAGQGHYGFDTGSGTLPYVPGLYFLLAGLPFSMGIPLYLLALVGLVQTLRRRSVEDVLLLSFVGAYYLVAGIGAAVFLRYLLPILPVVSIFAARAAVGLVAPGDTRRRALGVATVAAVVLYTAGFAWSTTARYADDTRDHAARALATLLPSQATVGIVGGLPNYYPGIHPGQHQLVVCDATDAAELNACRPDFLLVSGMQLWRPYRAPDQHRDLHAYFEALRAGNAGYRLVNRWESPYLHKDLYMRLDPMFEGYFVSPMIELYQRED